MKKPNVISEHGKANALDKVEHTNGDRRESSSSLTNDRNNVVVRCELCGCRCETNSDFRDHLAQKHPRLNWCRVKIERYRATKIATTINKVTTPIKPESTVISSPSSSMSQTRATRSTRRSGLNKL